MTIDLRYLLLWASLRRYSRRLLHWSKTIIQAHEFVSSLPQHYASFRQSGVSSRNFAENRAMGTILLTGIQHSTVLNNSLAELKSSSKTINSLESINRLGFYISQICWVVVLWIVKCSIVAFYWRLFSGNRRSTRIAIWIIAVAVMCWGIAVVRSSCLIWWIFFSMETVVAGF